MKYSTPEVRYAGSAIAAVQMQTQATKGGSVGDRADLLIYGPHNVVSNPAAYEADE